MSEFENRIVIITGGTRGIGAGLSKYFLEKGATVISTYRSNTQAAESFKSSIETDQERLHLRQFDVTDFNAVEKFYGDLESEFGKLDVLINNSGIRKDNIAPMMGQDEWNAVIDTNLNGCFYMTKFAIPLMMKNRYGRIINMSSVAARLGLQGQGNYSATKAAQIAFSKSVSKEIAKKGITINNIAPGFIETELISDLSDEQIKEYKKTVPMKRFGHVDEVAHAVGFLASTNAAYITGTTIDVAGGL